MIIRILAAWLAFSSIAEATTYYVGKSGNDGNSCATAQSSTAGNRKLTIAGGTACAGAGNADVVIVGDGTYTEQLTQSNFVSGTTYSNAMTLRCENHLGCVLKPDSSMQNAIDLSGTLAYVIIGVSGGGLDIDGSTLPDAGPPVYPRPLIKVWGDCSGGYNVHHIRFQYNDIHHKTSSGDNGSTIGTSGDNCATNDTYLDFLHNTFHDNGANDFSNTFYIQTSRNLIQGNVMHDSKGAGVALSLQNNGKPHNNTVVSNRCYAMGLTNTKGDCVLLAGANNNLIYNNIGSGSTDWSCINATESDPADNLIYNNTCYGNPLYGIYVGGTGNIVRNNIAYGNTTGNINNTGVGNTVSNNLTTDPSFTDAGTRDFTLQSGSAARDAGIDLSAAGITTDIIGTARPQNSTFDIGAYEYIVSAGGGDGGMSETPSWSSPRKHPLWRR